ncbi:hypothetical protein AJ80_09233 [Polytolypa hystricis UAMH7299]|uniref:CBF1-interacting co-repressor CIR N-terminal domain-containing protein n=1 Tax=Polytolypa hystricis (strain UAMH7299) TaxID=1447883 RepID=A0A2B7WUA2_POLH7|nr:hypothetical protein AJ80_09233 [Polytolypa hystricis UAMH7299]
MLKAFGLMSEWLSQALKVSATAAGLDCRHCWSAWGVTNLLHLRAQRIDDSTGLALNMVLHLLGKKSWNVYNRDNIARVRRDEAEAEAREEENRRRTQEAEADKRIQILRGLRTSSPSPPPDSRGPRDESTRKDQKKDDERSRHRKRRRLAGEDDTDRDIRLAREDVEKTKSSRQKDTLLLKSSRTDDTPIVNESGHINLFPEEDKGQATRRRSQKGGHTGEKNAEAEAEAAKKQREYEDQYTMRFSNAAGFKQGMQKPWYNSSSGQAEEDAMPSKDVWGNEDLGRREREKRRINSNDPLAMMKRGVKQLRDVEWERKKWDEERKRELRALEEQEREDTESRRHRRRKRRGSSASLDSLNGFFLDARSDDESRRRKDAHSSHRHHRNRRRHRSRNRSRDRTSKHSRRDSERHSHRSSKDSSSRTKDSRTRGEETGWTQAPGKRYSAQFAGT